MREFTVEEVDWLGKRLAPHLRMVIREENEPIKEELKTLRAKSRLWGAVSGSLTSLLIYLTNRWTA